MSMETAKNRRSKEFKIAIMPEEYHSVPNTAYLKLPASDEEIIDAFDRARVWDSEFTVEILDAKHEYLQRTLPPDPDLYELNHLAQRLSDLSDMEHTYLKAMVKMEEKSLDTAQVINLTYNLDGCVHANCNSYTELGHFAVDNGFFQEFNKHPTSILDALDYEALGRRFEAEQGGVLFDGVFAANTLSPEDMVFPYNGDPPVPDLQPRHIFRITLPAGQGGEIQLDLPATRYDLDKAAKQQGVDDLTDCNFILHKCSIPKLNEMISGNESIYDLDYLAEQLSYLRYNGDLVKFKAALEVTQCTGLEDFQMLSESLDSYDYYPEVVIEADYGEMELLREYGLDRTCTAMEHFDFTSFGRERMQEKGIASTPYGMIRRNDIEQTLSQEQNNNPDIGMTMQ